jgi:UDP-3-O-[3-hydroxymyristoyl] N-acetylglucosamine deacetylase
VSIDSKQKTLKSSITFNGRGLFTGEICEITLLPMPENSKIVFQRMDLKKRPKIPAKLSYVSQAVRSTSLKKDEASVQTVEHLMSSLYGLGLDNALIQIKGPEVPIFDGSALEFIQKIEEIGLIEQQAQKKIYTLKKPVYFNDGQIKLVAFPSDTFKVSYLLHYPNSEFLQAQYCSIAIEDLVYKKEIASCRTFSLYEEIEPLLKQGFLKGGGLENGVVIQNNRVLNPDGLRFSNEMARHKILDLIGDLSLIGKNFTADIIAIRSGHQANIRFAQVLDKQLRCINGR